jgi:hypothetical protein
MIEVQKRTTECNSICSSPKPCQIAKLAIRLDERLKENKSKPFGAKHLGWVKRIIPKAEKDNDCMWLLARLHIIFRKTQPRNKAEKEIFKLVNTKENREKIIKLLDLKD